MELEGGLSCASEIREFQQAWTELRHKPLSSISLDITPAINPNRDEQEETGDAGAAPNRRDIDVADVARQEGPGAGRGSAAGFPRRPGAD